MTNTVKKENNALKFFNALCACAGYGVKRLWREKRSEFLNILSFLIFCFAANYHHYIWKSSPWGLKGVFFPFIERLALAIPWELHFSFVTMTFGFWLLVLLGIKEYKTVKEYQKKIDIVGITGASGAHFNVISVVKNDEYKTTVVIKSVGIGIDKYQLKKTDLESSFAQEIDSISLGGNPQIIILNLTKRKLPSMVKFSDVEKNLLCPHSFLVGESMKGVVTRTLESLPHMLIAGTTGGGKSVFFKQMLLGLLKTTPQLQLYLLDLKRGVEMKEFSILPNVRIAKTEAEAVSMLERLKDEMDRRFCYLEKNGYKEIDIKRDGMDKIVVGIDEASVIYTKTKGNAASNRLVNRARELTDELAKLARASGIHLVLATQKVSKETIDTKVQENIGARICFRMNTLSNSLIVLGNKMACELPDTKGRAIWSSVNEFQEIQAPFLSEEELRDEIDDIKEKFDSNKIVLNGKMLELEGSSNDSQGPLKALPRETVG